MQPRASAMCVHPGLFATPSGDSAAVAVFSHQDFVYLLVFFAIIGNAISIVVFKVRWY